MEINQASRVEIFSLVDNCTDFLSPTNHKLAKLFGQWTREKYDKEWNSKHSQSPLAEHGFSMLIRVFNEGKVHSILYDTGSSPDTILENAKRMGIDLKEVESIVISHGHYDHFGGLLSVKRVIDRIDLPIIVHEDMFKTRGTALPDGSVRKFSDFPTENMLKPAKVITTKQPALIADNMVVITGEIPRKTEYEKGFLRHRASVNNSWQPDPLIIDERAIIIAVKGKGLIILSGCAHAGIINTISYAKQITGIEKIYAVLGGFHLAGKESENRIKPTIRELLCMSPILIAPSHCTGWRAINAIANALPDAFVWNSVGNLYQL